MAKKLNKNLLPPKEVIVEAQNVDPENVNRIALRRSKVRELMRMGYQPFQMVLILEKGIKIGKNQVVKVPISPDTVKNDIEYIRQGDLAEDIEFNDKRAEIKDKLDFLYQRAIQEYLNSKGATRATFMNTALSILGKIMDVEGIKSPENLNVNLNAETKIAKYSAEIHKLSEDDKSTILTAIRKVRKQRKSEGVGDTGVSNESSRISAQTSNDEGVPGKS